MLIKMPGPIQDLSVPGAANCRVKRKKLQRGLAASLWHQDSLRCLDSSSGLTSAYSVTDRCHFHPPCAKWELSCGHCALHGCTFGVKKQRVPFCVAHALT